MQIKFLPFLLKSSINRAAHHPALYAFWTFSDIGFELKREESKNEYGVDLSSFISLYDSLCITGAKAIALTFFSNKTLPEFNKSSFFSLSNSNISKEILKGSISLEAFIIPL